jgi:inward rectifier potassium channel
MGRNKPHRIRVGNREIVTHGLPRNFWADIYHLSMTASWPVFFACIASIFLLLNALFAGVYLLGDRPVANLAPDGFLGAFFFSVETLGTVGYGNMYPQSVYGHVVATIEIFVGSISLAVVTGVIFARFSRPRSRIICSRYPVVRPIDGTPTLLIRAANARQNVILEASARLRMIRSEPTAEGMPLRRLYDLKLTREHHPMLLLSWSIMHVIDETSPLYGIPPEVLGAEDTGFVLSIEGVDETTTQTMQARFMFTADQIRWNHAYLDLLQVNENGENRMDFSRFHDVVPL